MNASTRIRNRLLCLMIVLLAATSLAWSQKRGKPPKTPPPPPANSFLAFDSNGSIWLTDGADCGLLLANASNPTWSPDGSEVAFYREDSATGWGIYRAPIDGSVAPQLVTPLPGNPAYTHIDWSPCAVPTLSDMILFTANPAGESAPEVWAVHPDGTGLVRLTWDQSYYLAPHWSSDGTRFTVTRFDVSVHAIMVYDLGLDGTGELVLTGGIQLTHVPSSPIQGFAAWSALSNDGSWVVCRVAGGLAGGANDDLFKIDTSDPSNIVQLTFDPDERHRTPRFSANDAEVFFTTAARKSQLLAVVDAAGSSSDPVFLTPGFKASQYLGDIKP